MAGVRFTDLQTRPMEVLDVTRLTVDEFQQLVPPCEAAFQAHMTQGRCEGHPRTARRYTTYTHGPLPTPEDRLVCLVVSLKTYALQVVQGRLCGMGQRTAHPWLHVLVGVLGATLRLRGETPTRSVPEWATRLGVAEADAAAGVVPTPEPPTPPTLPTAAPTPVPAAPLVATRAPHGPSSVPRTRRHRRAVIAGRTNATR